MQKAVRIFRELLSFLTTLPVGVKEPDIKIVAQYVHFFPIIGFLIGVIIYAISAVAFVLPALVFSLTVIVAIYLITGINHLDGLLDFGDAITAHGSRVEKLRALKDSRIGAGGLLVGFLYLLFLLASLLNIYTTRYFILLIVSEIGAKLSMVVTAYFGKSSERGVGSLFVSSLSEAKLLSAILIALALLLILDVKAGFLSLTFATFSAFVISVIANKIMGYVTGDVLGASNEIGRLVCLLFIPLITK